jgi:hypothetical protein
MSDINKTRKRKGKITSSEEFKKSTDEQVSASISSAETSGSSQSQTNSSEYQSV